MSSTRGARQTTGQRVVSDDTWYLVFAGTKSVRDTPFALKSSGQQLRGRRQPRRAPAVARMVTENANSTGRSA